MPGVALISLEEMTSGGLSAQNLLLYCTSLLLLFSHLLLNSFFTSPYDSRNLDPPSLMRSYSSYDARPSSHVPPSVSSAGSSVSRHSPPSTYPSLQHASWTPSPSPPPESSGSVTTSNDQPSSSPALPTYTIPAEQCPPGDDRRHCCGICHRRFSRPSSLMTHMNTHTGAQREWQRVPSCAVLADVPRSLQMSVPRLFTQLQR